MAKRKTIRVNPLDTLVLDPTTSRTGESSAAAKAQSAGPASIIAQTTTQRNQPRAKNSNAPTSAIQVAQPPSPADLLSRVQSLEEQNEYMKWLLGGAILLAIML
jgi:hypothetical protein